MTGSELQDDPRIVWHPNDDEAAWVRNSVNTMDNALRTALESTASHVRLLVSGGSTPRPIYTCLANLDLDWSRVVVGLVDDRDVPADNKGSNARTIREQLLRDRAAVATFQPLRETAATLEGAIDAANRRWRDAAEQPIVAALLGMGDDGHTASLFPDAGNLETALVSNQPYIHIDATGCPIAGDYPQRLSMTPFGLAQARQRLLLIRGSAKRDTLVAALANGPVAAMPIRAAWQAPLAPLQVHWCANE